MLRYIRIIKDKAYYYLVDKNSTICQEYNWYVDAHMEEHRKKPWIHWWLILRLNWHYRVRHANTSFLEGFQRKQPQAPYLQGPESDKRKWDTAYHFAQSLLKYDVISFDVFDTLVLRKLNIPTDVFAVVGGRLGLADFYNVRRKSEKEARDIREKEKGNRETNIYEIYDRVSCYLNVDPAETARLELQTELDVCYANPYLQRVYRILKSMGKTVIATSDMYLPKEWMKELLDNCGYNELDEIYVSCDYECSKTDGGLFNVLRTVYGEQASIVHIGDNFKSDVQMFRELGGEARHYLACRNLGNPHRCAGMSPLIESAYRAIVNNTLHNGIKSYSMAWEYGFTYGGLATLGYVHWIHRNVMKSGITKVLFLARDGFVLKKAFDLLFSDVETEYVYWSRSAAIRSAAQIGRYYFLDQFLYRRKNSKETIADALRICDIESCSSIFLENGFELTAEITDENIESLQDIVLAHWDMVERCLENSKNCMENYIRKVTKEKQKVAIVDLGFSGRNTLIFKEVLESITRAQAEVYLLGNSLLRENADFLLSGELKCYMFDNLKNPGIRAEFISNGRYACFLFERMFGAPHPSFMGFNHEGEMEFAPVEAENDKKLLEIQEGILEFCRIYQQSFENFPEFFNISGWDAFRPISMLEKNRNYVNKTVGDLVQVLGVTNKNAISISDT